MEFFVILGGYDKGFYGITVCVLIIITNKIFYYLGLSEGHGFYFELNSFHHISLTELKIKEDLIEGFIPYIETIKSIIIHNDENDQSLLDTFLNINEIKNKFFNSHKLNVIVLWNTIP